MKILVVGNGFDIAHHLPTSYPCFLDFAKLLISDGKAKVPDDKLHYDMSITASKLLKEEEAVNIG